MKQTKLDELMNEIVARLGGRKKSDHLNRKFNIFSVLKIETTGQGRTGDGSAS